MDDVRWFRRLAEVPGVGYAGNSSVDRRRLPGAHARPEVHTYEFDGKRHTSLSWPSSDGSTSASPAKSWTSPPRRGEQESDAALRQLHEALELPGGLSDYHFAIQQCCEVLWQHRLQTPQVLQALEELCLLDIRLIESYPEIIRFENRDTTVQYATVRAYGILIRLYEREGYLHEALDLAKREGRFRPDETRAHVEELQRRIAALSEEELA